MRIPRTTIQTIEIPKTWTLKRSTEWLLNNGYNSNNKRDTIHFRRFLQTLPITGAHYYSKKLDNNIILVFQNY